MLAEDVSPSRIEAAKETINTFLADRGDDVFSLIVFAGKPFLSMGASDDVAGIRSVISGIDPSYIRQHLP